MLLTPNSHPTSEPRRSNRDSNSPPVSALHWKVLMILWLLQVQVTVHSLFCWGSAQPLIHNSQVKAHTRDLEPCIGLIPHFKILFLTLMALHTLREASTLFPSQVLRRSDEDLDSVASIKKEVKTYPLRLRFGLSFCSVVLPCSCVSTLLLWAGFYWLW